MGKVQCLACGKTLESKDQHDFVGCGCPNGTFVDGGNAYMRYGGADHAKIKVFETILDDEDAPIEIEEDDIW